MWKVVDSVSNLVLARHSDGSGGEWQWWYWVLIGVGALISLTAIVLLLVLPKKYEGKDYDEELDGYQDD